MDYISIFLAGVMLGLFAGAMVLVVILAHPVRPGWDLPPTRREPPPMPSVAQMPVVEAGCVSYQWINLTGLEDES